MPDQDVRRRIVAATLDIAAERGWTGTRLADVAEAAALSLSEVYRLYPTRQAIVADLSRIVDEEILGATGRELREEPVRDRLFDLLMRRFDALAPFKAGLRAMARTGTRDAALLCAGGCALTRSMRWILEAAGIGADGIGGRLRVHGLGLIYLDGFRAWLDDDSADLGRTMSVLDRDLKRADRLMSMCGCERRRPAGRGEAPPPDRNAPESGPLPEAGGA